MDEVEQIYTAVGYLIKAAGDAVDAPVLSGRLVASNSGWLLLTVPNDLVRGLFAAMDVLGIELPTKGSTGLLNAHISVMRPEELEKIPGGIDAITERGKLFHYQIGPVQEVAPAGWSEMSRVWFVKVKSPELQNLRKSYGLSALPNEDKFNFHITAAVKRKHVLKADSGVSKAASPNLPEVCAHDKERFDCEVCDGEDCPHCGASMERGGDGYCNRCGKDWPMRKEAGKLTAEDFKKCEHGKARFFCKECKLKKSATVVAPVITIQQLQKIKALSDNRRYREKHHALRSLMLQSPDQFTIDTDVGPHPGITHVPTGFQFHTARGTIPSALKAACDAI